MSTLNVDKAEQRANEYVQSLNGALSAADADYVHEDFVAGYLQAQKDANNFKPESGLSKSDTDFLLSQLKAAYDMATSNNEFYSQSILRYTLMRLNKL